MRPTYRPLLTLLLGLLAGLAAGLPARAQDRETTEERLRDLQQQIQEDVQRLSQTRQAEETSAETLASLDRQLALRRELVKNYERRIAQIEVESDSIRSTVALLEEEIGRLRSQYRERAQHAYKYGRLHDLALILAARSINEMLVRVRYLRRFSEQRREQFAEIAAKGEALQARRAALEAGLTRNEELLRGAEAEQRKMTDLQRERREVIAQLRARRGNLEEKLRRDRAAAQQLETRIQELVASESTRRAEREAVNPAAAAEYIELSGSFRQNKGGMPWPSSGVVQEPFGETVHPVYGTRTPNPGVLIATSPAAEVRAIFDGEVSDVSIIPEYGTYVVVAHGEYRSIYSNFSMLYVAKGDQVRAGQVIGRAGTDGEPKGNGIFFALFERGQAIDPVPWLQAR